MTFIDPLPGVMSAALNRIVKLAPEAQNRVARENGYEMRVHARLFDLVAAFEELEHLVDFLGRTKSFQEISLLIKLYIIGRVTLSDILANIINEVFDLGYAEQDIQFGVIMRNRKVRRGSLPQVVKTHSRAIQYDKFIRRRNDIVHRGKLDDAELADVRGAVLSAVVMKTIRVDQNDTAAVKAATREASLEIGASGRIQDLLTQKRSQFSEHLTATRSMLAELAPLLVERINAQPQETA
jgi:hypothetical protein